MIFNRIMPRNTFQLLRLMVLWLMALCTNIFFVHKCLADESKNPVVFEVSLSSMGQQSNVLKIYQDGNVHFHKYDFIQRDGTLVTYKNKDHYTHLSKSQLDELVIEFLSFPFKELPKIEAKRGFDFNVGSIVIFKIPFVEITINNYLFYRTFYTKLKKYLGKELKDWFCFPEGHKDYDKDCPNHIYLPENFQF